MFVHAVQFKLLSNLFSFQRQMRKTSMLLGSLISTTDYFPHWKDDYFHFRKNGFFEDENFHLFSQFILVICSYILIKYFIHFIAPTLLFLHLR